MPRPRKTTPAPAAQTSAAAEAKRHDPTVVFMGRTMRIKPELDPTQMAIMGSTGTRIGEESAEWDLKVQAVAGRPKDDPTRLEVEVGHNKWAMWVIGRGLKMLSTVLADPDDLLWIEDKILEGKTDLQQAMQIIMDALKANTAQDEDGDASTPRRPAAKKPAAKKASRVR